ncbi:cytochrome P450 [Streptomyces sp. NPDC046261]|uniref:cytochrome P450 n=1 Tax=Streptomyces sp. NPDC046261 TaxID=3157200 RepID=UPI0033D4A595
MPYDAAHPSAVRPPVRAPGALPLLGHFPQLARDPLRFLGSLPAHGDLVEVRAPFQRVYVLCHPALAQQALTDGRTFDRTGPVFDRVRAEMGNGLATCSHAAHRRQRLMVQPAFRRERLGRYAEVMREEIPVLMRGWRPGQVVDMVDAMFTLTTSVAVRTLFSSRVDARTTAGLRECLDTFLRGVYRRNLLPFTTVLPTPANRRYTRALDRWRLYVRRIVDEARRTQGTGPDDLLSWLLAARDETDTGLSEQELHDQIAVLVLAGAETTSGALAWAWHLLAAHPGAEARLHAEVDAELRGGSAGLEDLPRLAHTARVVKETLRLYPPAWIIPRTVTRETALAGRALSAGALLLFSPYVLHRRADAFPEPHRFLPERWQPEAADRPAALRTAFLPFGAGPTKCVGESFALTEACLAVASIAARWRPRPVPGVTVRPAPRTVLAPETLPMRLDAR